MPNGAAAHLSTRRKRSRPVLASELRVRRLLNIGLLHDHGRRSTAIRSLRSNIALIKHNGRGLDRSATSLLKSCIECQIRSVVCSHAAGLHLCSALCEVGAAVALELGEAKAAPWLCLPTLIEGGVAPPRRESGPFLLEFRS